MNNDQIKHMTQRFLQWRLPEPFRPDSGISFTPPSHPASYPIGTNLFDADQAEAMIRHLVEGMCDWCGSVPVAHNLDGDNLCLPCCNKWARAEGIAAQERESESL